MVRPSLLLVTGLPGAGKSTLAEGCAPSLEAAVLGHDWVAAGLVPFPTVRDVLAEMDRVEARAVGWSVMWSLARAQLRAGRSVILDGVARSPEVVATRRLATDEKAQCVVVLVECLDAGTHRRRIETRRRSIPNWPELSWSEVARSRAGWSLDAPVDVDLRVDGDARNEDNVAAVAQHLH